MDKIQKLAVRFGRPTKLKDDDDLREIEEQVNNYRDVVQQVAKKISIGGYDEKDKDRIKDKRLKKVHEHVLGNAMEQSANSLPEHGMFKEILANCADLEKKIAEEIVQHEMNIENEVINHLNNIISEQIALVKKQKNVVTKCQQDYENVKKALQSAEKVNDSAKISQCRDDQEELQKKLEKERDIYAACMYDVLAEEENIASYIVKYVTNQELLYKSALDEIQRSKQSIDKLMGTSNKKIFSKKLEDHLCTSKRKVSFVIELCVCFLSVRGLNEEGLLRVGCGNSKLKRMKSAIDANMVHLPLQLEYQDVHLIASLLKSYLRSLPEPLLTFKYYTRFISACQMASDAERKSEIYNIIKELKDTREDYYTNLKYLMKFLSKLSENHQINKMSTQNIAIVMSPNLLWSPNDSDEGNYALQVNSTAFGNSIVETLIADWHYFFGEDNIDFFETITKDKLLGINGENGNDTQLGRNVMSSSFNTQKSHASHNSSAFTSVDSSAKKHSHSRGSSYDASQILQTDRLKESQSNSSLSDHSSPTHGSPKPNNRNKKKNAPVPPPLTTLGGEELQFIDSDADDHKTGKVRAAKSTENLLRPEKPARPPAINAECQTMGRKNHYSPSKIGEEPFKRQVPVPAVRTSVAVVKPGISKSDDEDIILRQTKPTEKPQIPERPQIAKRPASFRGSVSVTTPTEKFNHFETSFGSKPQLNKNNSCPIDDGDPRTFTGNESNVDKKIPTVLERTQVYNIDKQQVAIVDVSSNNSNTPCPPPLPPGLARKDVATKNENKENSQNSTCKFLSSEIQDTNNLMTTSTSSVSSDHNPGAVPQSPRSLDGKVKRPQVPPPARPKSSDGDNTKL